MGFLIFSSFFFFKEYIMQHSLLRALLVLAPSSVLVSL